MHLFRIMPKGHHNSTHPKMPAFKTWACTKENNAREIVTDDRAENIDLGNKVFKFTNFCEDGFPFLTYLAQKCPVAYLGQAEAYALEAALGKEEAAYIWFKNQGYTAVICRFYDQPKEGEEIDFVWLIK